MVMFVEKAMVGEPSLAVEVTCKLVAEVRVNVQIIGLVPKPVSPLMASSPLHVIFPGKPPWFTFTISTPPAKMLNPLLPTSESQFVAHWKLKESPTAKGWEKDLETVVVAEELPGFA